MRVRQRVGRNIITSIRHTNIVLIYQKVTSLNACANMNGPTYLVARFVLRIPALCVTSDDACHNSQTYTWNDVIPYKGRMIRIFFKKHLSRQSRHNHCLPDNNQFIIHKTQQGTYLRLTIGLLT